MRKLLLLYLPLAWFTASLIFGLCWSAFMRGETLWQLLGHIPLRRLCFGWICRLREQHVGKLISVWRYMLTGGVTANYRCCCGQVQSHWVDVPRGGKILPKWVWRDRA